MVWSTHISKALDRVI